MVHSPFRGENSEPRRRRSRDLFSLLRVSIRAYTSHFRLYYAEWHERDELNANLHAFVASNSSQKFKYKKILTTRYYRLSSLPHLNLRIRFRRSSDYLPDDRRRKHPQRRKFTIISRLHIDLHRAIRLAPNLAKTNIVVEIIRARSNVLSTFEFNTFPYQGN